MKAKTDFKSTGYFEGNHRGAQAQTLTKPWFKSQLCQLLALWPWLSCLISLCLSLFCKMRTIRVPPSLEVVWESEMTLGVLYSVHAQCYPCSVQYKGWWSAVLLAFRGNNFWGFSVLEVKKLEVLVSLDFLSQQMIAWITLCAVSHILPFATCLHQQNADGNRTIKKKMNGTYLSTWLQIFGFSRYFRPFPQGETWKLLSGRNDTNLMSSHYSFLIRPQSQPHRGEGKKRGWLKKNFYISLSVESAGKWSANCFWRIWDISDHPLWLALCL